MTYTPNTTAILATSALVAAAVTAGLAGAAQAQVAERPAPVELAITNSDPVECQPEPLLLPAGSIIDLRIINNSVNSTIVVLDELLQAQVQTEESDLAVGATAEMAEGYNLGPGQERNIAFATVEAGNYSFTCRSPAADEGGEAPASLIFEGEVRVE